MNLSELLALSADYSNPADLAVWADSWELPLHGGEEFQMVGGPFDGDWLAVPVMFGQLAPQFVTIDNHIYQLRPFERRWKFSFTMGRDWAGYRPADADATEVERG